MDAHGSFLPCKLTVALSGYLLSKDCFQLLISIIRSEAVQMRRSGWFPDDDASSSWALRFTHPERLSLDTVYAEIAGDLPINPCSYSLQLQSFKLERSMSLDDQVGFILPTANAQKGAGEDP